MAQTPVYNPEFTKKIILKVNINLLGPYMALVRNHFMCKLVLKWICSWVRSKTLNTGVFDLDQCYHIGTIHKCLLGGPDAKKEGP